MVITTYAEARAVLENPRYVPPPARRDAEPRTLAWLRGAVSRFSTGPEHARRRQALEELLTALDPDELRSAARALTLERDGAWRGVPTAVLGAVLGVADTDRLVQAVRAAAPGYLSGAETPEADAAVAELLTLTPAPGRVARVTLLLQGYAATEGLLENTLAHARPGDDADGLLLAVLRDDPPLKVTRRIDRESGAEVVIDLVAANRDAERFGAGRHLTFGAGSRPCPAPRHALALAAGVLAALLETSPAKSR